MNYQKITIIGAALALVFLAACSTGSVLGGPSASSAQEIRGTVDSVDTGSRSVVLRDVNTYNPSLNNSSTVRIYWDDRTAVDYNGVRYNPADLERGDQVSARVDQSGSRLVAESFTVLYDVSGGGSTYPSGTYGTTMRGTVQYVDASRHTLQIDRGTSGTYGTSSLVVLDYDPNTTVQYNGRSYRVEDLERGDEIDVTYRDLGASRYLAQAINVVRDVNGGTGAGTSTTFSADLRGTVRYVDTTRRTIELQRATWQRRFTTGGSDTVVLQYDASTTVEYQGQMYAPTNLEAGDIIDVQVRDLGTSLLAQRIVVVQSVRG